MDGYWLPRAVDCNRPNLATEVTIVPGVVGDGVIPNENQLSQSGVFLSESPIESWLKRSRIIFREDDISN